MFIILITRSLWRYMAQPTAGNCKTDQEEDIIYRPFFAFSYLFGWKPNFRVGNRLTVLPLFQVTSILKFWLRKTKKLLLGLQDRSEIWTLGKDLFDLAVNTLSWREWKTQILRCLNIHFFFPDNSHHRFSNHVYSSNNIKSSRFWLPSTVEQAVSSQKQQ